LQDPKRIAATDGEYPLRLIRNTYKDAKSLRHDKPVCELSRISFASRLCTYIDEP